MKLYIKIIIAICLSGLSAHTHADQAVYTQKDVKLKHYNWKGTVPGKRLVKVYNPFGNISSSNTSRNEIELGGVIQQVGDIKKPYEVKITESAGITEIRVLYPEGVKSVHDVRIARFDLGVYVPANVAVYMQTDFGDIKAKKHRSHLQALSNSGRIKLGTAGTVQANSKSGDIKVDLYADNWYQEQNISSIYGDIQLSLVHSADINLNLQAASITAKQLDDYDTIKVLSQSDKQLFAKFTSGKHKLNAKSLHGELMLKVLDRPSFYKKPGLASLSTRQ